MIITIPSFGLGKSGGDRVLVTLANNLAERGHVINIINLGKKPVSFGLSKKVNLVSVPFGASKKKPLDFMIKGINKLADNLPVSDIYLANWVYTVLPCIANNDRGQTVFLAQANEARDFKEKDLKILNGISYEAHKLNIPIITPSVYLQKLIKKRFLSKAIVIPPFVNTDTFRPGRRNGEGGKLRLLFVGNIRKENKGFGILLKACKKLKNIPFELHVATPVDSKITDSKMDLLIHRPKDDKELSAIYQSCDIFFNLSKEEGFGLTLLEAMACGLVCVATDSGGVREFAVDGKNCLFVERNYRAVISVIEKISKDFKYFQKQLPPEAIKTAKFYPEEKMASSFEKLFLKAKRPHFGQFVAGLPKAFPAK
ncbi:MAG: glycosyltransferase family 4 protein [Candidatus Moraniibacteriota bacterium]